MNENCHGAVEMIKSITTDGTDSVRSVDMKPYNETPMFDARGEDTRGEWTLISPPWLRTRQSALSMRWEQCATPKYSDENNHYVDGVLLWGFDSVAFIFWKGVVVLNKHVSDVSDCRKRNTETTLFLASEHERFHRKMELVFRASG